MMERGLKISAVYLTFNNNHFIGNETNFVYFHFAFRKIFFFVFERWCAMFFMTMEAMKANFSFVYLAAGFSCLMLKFCVFRFIFFTLNLSVCVINDILHMTNYITTFRVVTVAIHHSSPIAVVKKENVPNKKKNRSRSIKFGTAKTIIISHQQPLYMYFELVRLS